MSKIIKSLETIELTKTDKIFLLSMQEKAEKNNLNHFTIFDSADANHDGKITWAEFGELLRNHFEELDFSKSFKHIFKKANIANDDKLSF